MTLGLFDGNEGRIDGPPPIEGVGVARRVLARVIDVVVLQLAIGVGAAAAYLAASVLVDSLGPGTAAAIERLANASSSSWRGSWHDVALGLLGLTLLHTLCEGLHGSTIGKRVCGITVVSESGTPAGIRAGLKRSLGFLVDQIAFGLVGIHKILNSPLQQRVGDEWAHTVVVRSKALAPGSRRSGWRFVAATVGHRSRLDGGDRVPRNRRADSPPLGALRPGRGRDRRRREATRCRRHPRLARSGCPRGCGTRSRPPRRVPSRSS